MEGTRANDQWDRVRRLFGEIAFRYLSEKSVGVVGLGSGGSVVTQYLAMVGVRRFLLVDPDVLDEHNIVRHALDLRYVGKPKVLGMQDLILHRNPQAEVSVFQNEAEAVLTELADVDLILVCVDAEPARHFICMKAREMGIVTITAGAYEKAAGGDVVINYPDQGPCYSCAASELAVSESEPRTPVLDYGQVRADGTLQGEPGLGLHIARIALAQADFALRNLLSGTDSPLDSLPGNVYIMANNRQVIGTNKEGRDVILNPGEARWITLKSKPGCRICQISNQPTEVSVDDIL